ncbi:MAG TPA: hypothetical protein VGG38_16950 [Acidimicrobiales bacterium]
MKHTSFVRRAATIGAAAASCLLSFLLFTPSAFAGIVEPIGDGSTSAVAPRTAPLTAHIVATGGLTGWQITLIAVGAALMAAMVAVFTDRARTAHRGMRVSAAH